MGMSPVGLVTKNHCAGESQQQFTGLDWAANSISLLDNGWVNAFPWHRTGGGVILYAYQRKVGDVKVYHVMVVSFKKLIGLLKMVY
jgi:hypothetical protein